MSHAYRGRRSDAERYHEGEAGEIDGDLMRGHLTRSKHTHQHADGGERAELQPLHETDRNAEPQHGSEGREMKGFTAPRDECATQRAPPDAKKQQRHQPSARRGRP